MALQAADAVEPSSTSVPWVYLSSLTFLLAGAIFYLYLARVLSYSDLGAVVILSAVASIMTVVFSLGIGPAFQHYLSFYQGRSEPMTVRRLVRSALFFALVLSATSAGATLALSSGLSDFFFHTRAYSGAIAILAIFAGVQTANSVLQSILLGLQRFATYSIVFIIGSAATYGLALAFFWILPGVDSLVMGWALGASLACLLYLAVILRPSNAWSRKATPVTGHGFSHAVLTYSLPLFAWSVLATGALYVDRLVLASIDSLATVGVYNYALLIASGSLVVAGPFAKILIPKASRSFGQQNVEAIRSLTRSAITLIVLIYVPVALGLAALGPFLLRYLAGPGFVSASVPMIVLLVISAVFVPYSVLSSIAAGTRRTMAFARAAGLALGANIALSVFLVPRFGMLGAAFGNSSMVWAPFIVFYLELHGSGLVGFDLRSLSRVWLATGVMSAAVGIPLWFVDYDPVLVPVFVLVGAACLVVSLRLVRAITAETATILLQILPRQLCGLRRAIYWLSPGYFAEGIQSLGRGGLTYRR